MYINRYVKNNNWYQILDTNNNYKTTKNIFIYKKYIHIDLSELTNIITNNISVNSELIHIPIDVEWNGSNYSKDTRECMLASLIHDQLCIYINSLDDKNYKLRRLIDDLYYRMLLDAGMNRLRAYIRLCGLRFWNVIR